MDKIIQEDCIKLITIEIIIEEIISEVCRFTEVKILEVDTEGIIEMIILEEVGGGLGRDNIQKISGGMIKVVVNSDQAQELVLI